jgi:hypothetical protein
VLKLDDRGMSVVPRPVVEKMAKNFAQAGVLISRARPMERTG